MATESRYISGTCAAKRCWYAVATRSRHERSVERALQRLGTVETYVPLRRVWSRRVDRRFRIDVPALPGYVFVRAYLDPETRAAIKRTSGVVGFVGTEGLPARIPAEQIESLRIMLRSSADVEVVTQLEVGQRVRVKAGPLAGATGILIRRNPSQFRLVVRIEHVGMALSADVHEADVEPLEADRSNERSRPVGRSLHCGTT